MPAAFNFETFNDDKLIIEYIQKKELIILDGLQRTFVLIELFEENPEADWLNHPIRCEVYIGLQKLIFKKDDDKNVALAIKMVTLLRNRGGTLERNRVSV